MKKPVSLVRNVIKKSVTLISLQNHTFLTQQYKFHSKTIPPLLSSQPSAGPDMKSATQAPEIRAMANLSRQTHEHEAKVERRLDGSAEETRSDVCSSATSSTSNPRLRCKKPAPHHLDYNTAFTSLPTSCS